MINKRKQAHDKLQPDNNQERPLVSLRKDKKPENQSPLTWFSLQPQGGRRWATGASPERTTEEADTDRGMRAGNGR